MKLTRGRKAIIVFAAGAALVGSSALAGQASASPSKVASRAWTAHRHVVVPVKPVPVPASSFNKGNPPPPSGKRKSRKWQPPPPPK